MSASPAKRRSARASSGIRPAVRAPSPDTRARTARATADGSQRRIDSHPPPERLYRIAAAAIRRVLGPGHADADDMLQTAMERVIRGLQRGQFAGQCSLPTWIATVARHAALDERRARLRADRSSPRATVSAEVIPATLALEDQIEARDLLDRMSTLLRSMDRLTADIIVLHDFAGHRLAEIASLKQISVAAAQSRLVRGRRELLHRLDRLRARATRGQP